MPTANDHSLASDVTVSRYRKWEEDKEKKKIAGFVKKRFCERYIEPFRSNEKKHGFVMMASACLMIESLESFRNGWGKSPNSSLAFCQFFDRSEGLVAFRGKVADFYKHVRCGIMHQGETTGGWRILRKGTLFKREILTINATKFLDEVEKSLRVYSDRLASENWDHELWKNFRKKMTAVCKNTQTAS